MSTPDPKSEQRVAAAVVLLTNVTVIVAILLGAAAVLFLVEREWCAGLLLLATAAILPWLSTQTSGLFRSLDDTIESRPWLTGFGLGLITMLLIPIYGVSAWKLQLPDTNESTYATFTQVLATLVVAVAVDLRLGGRDEADWAIEAQRGIRSGLATGGIAALLVVMAGTAHAFDDRSLDSAATAVAYLGVGLLAGAILAPLPRARQARGAEAPPAHDAS